MIDVHWWDLYYHGEMDSDPVMLAFCLLSTLSVLIAYAYWKWMQCKAEAAR